MSRTFLHILGLCAQASSFLGAKENAKQILNLHHVTTVLYSTQHTTSQSEQVTMVFVVSIALITFLVGRIDWTKCMKIDDGENEQEEE